MPNISRLIEKKLIKPFIGCRFCCRTSYKRKTAFQSKADHSRTGYRHAAFAVV